MIIKLPPWELCDSQRKTLLRLDNVIFKKISLKSPIFYNNNTQCPPADTSWPSYIKPLPIEIDILDNVICLPNRVLLQNEKVCKESFIKHPTHFHGGLILKDGFYNIVNQNILKEEPKFIDTAIYADTAHPHCFGHVLLEVIASQLYATKFLGMKFKILTSVNIKKYIRWFELYNIKYDDIIQIASPIIVSKLIVPTPLVRLRRYIHPVALNFTREVLKNNIPTTNIGPYIYISRSNIKTRSLKNEKEIEYIFSKHGFHIVHPEEYSPLQQISIFNNALFIAGTGGSAMHNIIFCNKNAKILYLSSRCWIVVADMLISQFLHNRLGYVLGQPDDYSFEKHYRSQNSWSISTEDVKIAIRKHFFE